MTIPILGADVPIVGEQPTPPRPVDLLNLFSRYIELSDVLRRLLVTAGEAVRDGDVESLLLARVQIDAVRVALADTDDDVALTLPNVVPELLKGPLKVSPP